MRTPMCAGWIASKKPIPSGRFLRNYSLLALTQKFGTMVDK